MGGDYLDKVIKVNLITNHYYVGKVIHQQGKLITLIDREGKEVTFSIDSVISLEVRR